jgi:uncharacterized membrane protein
MPNGAVHHPLTRRALGFVETTLVGGVVFLVPMVIVTLLAAKSAVLLARLGRPLAALLPFGPILDIIVADTLLILAAILGCFLAGLIARVSFANAFLKKAEAGVLWRIPGYGLVKGLTDSLDKSAAGSMRPVLIHFDDSAQLAFEVDRLADGRRVIYVPSSPDPRAGAVMVMDQDRVEAMPISFLATLRALRSLGRGASAWLTTRH